MRPQTVRPLPPDEAERLRALPLTYDEVGATAGPLPAGYHHLDRSHLLARRDLDGAAADLLSWRMQERAGLGVEASETPLVEGTVVVVRLGVGRLSLANPCRVLEVVDEPRRRGFVYGTLPGHAESGEERFLVEQRDDGALVVRITAFSRPGTLLTRLGGPVGRGLQAYLTRRYLRALDG